MEPQLSWGAWVPLGAQAVAETWCHTATHEKAEAGIGASAEDVSRRR